MGPVYPKIAKSYITLTALKVFVNILAWCRVIVRHYSYYSTF